MINESEQNHGFGNLRSNPVKGKISTWVILYTDAGNNFPGFLKEIKEDFAVLNPFIYGGCYVESGVGRRKFEFREGDSLVRLSNIVGVDPVTKEDLESYCAYRNIVNNSDKAD